MDVTVPPNLNFTYSFKGGFNAFIYILEGTGFFGDSREKGSTEQLVLFEKEGNSIQIGTDDEKVRCLIISGKPIGEPVAWRGPIVMNTEEELDIAFREYQNGTFIKDR